MNPAFKKFLDRKSAAKYEYYRRVEAMAFSALEDMKNHGVLTTDPDYRAVYQSWWWHRRKASRHPLAEQDGKRHV